MHLLHPLRSGKRCAPTSLFPPSAQVGKALADSYGVLVPSHTPPGEYQIEVGMYDLKTMCRLVAFDEAGKRLADDRILLDKVIRISD